MRPFTGKVDLRWTGAELAVWIGKSTGTDPAYVLPYRMSPIGAPLEHMNNFLNSYDVRDVLGFNNVRNHDPREEKE